MPPSSSLPTVADLMRVATAYLAQRATSSQHLRGVLERRVRRRLAEGERFGDVEPTLTPLIDEVMSRLGSAGLIDDAAYAASRARGLAAKGLPSWRIARELADKGLDPAHEAVAPLLDVEAEAQARRYAERKRLGRYGSRGDTSRGDASQGPSRVARDLAAMVRAGFSRRVAEAALRGDDLDRSALEEDTDLNGV